MGSDFRLELSRLVFELPNAEKRHVQGDVVCLDQFQLLPSQRCRGDALAKGVGLR